MSIIIFLLTLSVLVFVHEFGHFIAAKKSGVDVEEFGFGLPPRIFGKHFKGTIYSINLLPIGGFVRLKGEGGEVLGFGNEGSFSAAPKKKRALIIVAGVFGNLLLSYLILTFLFVVGSPRLSGKITIDEINKSSPAELVGVKPGDIILSANGKSIDDSATLIQITNGNKGKEMTLSLKRGSETVDLKIVPRVTHPENEGPLGVKLSTVGEIVYDKYSVFIAPLEALKAIGANLVLMFMALVSMLQSLLSVKVPEGVTGVVGIYKLSTEASQIGVRVFLQFVSLVSLNLFVFNLLPLPALDGGRLLFVILEKIFKKRISLRIENAINNFGMAFLLLIFVLITFSDIKRFYLH